MPDPTNIDELLKGYAEFADIAEKDFGIDIDLYEPVVSITSTASSAGTATEFIAGMETTYIPEHIIERIESFRTSSVSIYEDVDPSQADMDAETGDQFEWEQEIEVMFTTGPLATSIEDIEALSDIEDLSSVDVESEISPELEIMTADDVSSEDEASTTEEVYFDEPLFYRDDAFFDLDPTDNVIEEIEFDQSEYVQDRLIDDEIQVMEQKLDEAAEFFNVETFDFLGADSIAEDDFGFVSENPDLQDQALDPGQVINLNDQIDSTGAEVVEFNTNQGMNVAFFNWMDASDIFDIPDPGTEALFQIG